MQQAERRAGSRGRHGREQLHQVPALLLQPALLGETHASAPPTLPKLFPNFGGSHDLFLKALNSQLLP